ncbi:hypothetical protein COO60DRAFT_464932 [Scenedesmus sp. NREL 46B-D3]|nr:hypothetical protein COO60DRAFT_464932 [Scenedesmus sp. NREL 46B-D3]
MHSVLQPSLRCRVTQHAVGTSRRGCAPRHLLCLAAAAKQQPQPSSSPSLTDVMQQYRGLVATPSKTTQQASKAGSSSRADAGSSQPSAKRSAVTAGPQGGAKQPRSGASTKGAAGSAGARRKAADADTAGDKRGGPGSRSTSRSKQDSSRASSSRPSRSKQDGKNTSSSSSSSSSTKDSSKNPVKAAAAAKPPPPPSSSLLPSSGKGFGSLASSSTTRAAAAAARQPSSTPSSSSSSSSTPSTSGRSSKRVVKVFRFGVEAAAVQRAVNACGWQERVLQVDAISQADLLIAVKDTAGGRHQNLTQGERSAKNAGIPFVVVGRRMTKDSLHKALNPFLNEQTPAEVAAYEAERVKAAERKAFADAFFSSAQARNSGSGGAAAGSSSSKSSSSSSSSRAAGSLPSSRGNRGLPRCSRCLHARWWWCGRWRQQGAAGSLPDLMQPWYQQQTCTWPSCQPNMGPAQCLPLLPEA